MKKTSKRETRQIFDLIFKRLVQEASPRALIAMVNGLFSTNYPPDSPIFFPTKENITGKIKQITSDILLMIGQDTFHFEAQIDNSPNMALRMFRYGYEEAIKSPQTGEDGILTITFPQSLVLYWEATRKTPDNLKMRIVFSDQSLHNLAIPTFKLLEHEIGELEEMRLALLLPFYVLKYRKALKAARSEEKRLALAPKMKETLERLLEAIEKLREAGILTEEDEEVILGETDLLYTELYKPYKGFWEAKAMVDERIMTRFDKVRMEGEAKGIAKGRAEGEARGISKGRTEGRAEVARNLLKAGISRDIIAQATGLAIADIGG
jgi:predicted transposase/invertase (TIGR01784 family)